MTPFSALQSLCGLSNREAAEFLGITESAVEKFRRGSRAAPSGVLRELQALWAEIDRTAIEAAEEMVRRGIMNEAAEIEVGYPADDYEAQQLGLPCAGAWRQMLARLIDEMMVIDENFDPARIRLVPRGSTPATAAAADIHRK